MLSVSDIINIVCPIQEDLIKTKKGKKTIKNTDSDILDYKKKDYKLLEEVFNNEYFVYTGNQTRNNLNNYLFSILSILDPDFNMKEKKYKIEIINELIKKMIIDYDSNNLYYIYNYNKSKKIKKTTIPSYLHEYLNKKKITNIEILQQFICDYFSINIFIFYKENGNIKSKFLYTKQYNNIINKYVPVIMLYKESDIYYTIYNNDIQNSIVLYSKNKKLLHKLYNLSQVFIEGYIYNKLTLKELRQKLLKDEISIKKKSETSGKEIYLKKSELLDIIRLNYVF